MRVSLKWAQQFSNFDFLKDGEEKLLERIGAQLGAIDEVVRWGERYDGIIVVKIVRCEQHPNADNLKLCWIDDNSQFTSDIKRGDNNLVQVVCGGPNARADMYAAWIPPGKIVPSSIGNKEPFKLEVREIRGQVSNGMLASPSELGISDEQAGILEVKASDIGREPKAGEPLAGLYDLDDTIVDIENKMFTHRPDLFGILGVARELAGITNQKFTSPAWYASLAPGSFEQTAFEDFEFSLENKVADLVPRFLAIAMSDIKVGPSPYWMQAGLTRIGIKPINNAVDITNFVMHITGQPLHAFDYDKVVSKGSAGLEARLANEGEELMLLGGKTIKLSKDNIVIASQNGPAISLAGIMGGVDTEVDENTKNVILECANFDMYSIRKTSMQHGLFTDASTRFTKGQSSLQNDVVMAYAVQLMSELAGAKTASGLIDINHAEQNLQPINIEASFINDRLGLGLSPDECASYLNNVEINTVSQDNSLKVSVPFWRTDLHINEDIVEEVGRLHGYDKLPQALPKKDLNPAVSNKFLDLKAKIRQIMSRAGANELLTYSFVNGRLLELAGQDENLAFHIRNALSPNLQFYRLSLLPSLLEKVHPNVKLGYDKFAIYEQGKVHLKTASDEQELPVEQNRLAIVINRPGKSASYYQVQCYLRYLLGQLNINGYSFEPLPNCQRALSHEWVQTANSFEPKHSAGILVGSALIGIIGEPNSKAKRGLKLTSSVACLELDSDKLLELGRHLDYQELNKYPSTMQDITFKASYTASYSDICQKIAGFLDVAHKQSGYCYRLKALDIFAKDNDTLHKNISWGIELWHPQKTLKTEEVNNLLDELAKKIKNELNIDRI